MPRAGGPLDYGLRAGGPWVGFLMGWSMFLECLFGGVATALAGGKYIAFLISPDDEPNKYVAVAVGLDHRGRVLSCFRPAEEGAGPPWYG